MNPRKQTSGMHFKSAQIAGVEISPNDMAQINQYALSPLDPDDIFAFKVSMAANEIDRDHEVFPRKTLKKLADLFVGKTVVKDHDHRSDNQIARIYATELMDSAHMHLTKTEEVYSELIAKCYMVKTSTNADLISEIRAGIRKEVSLGCRIGKAVCSICGTDNAKTYCMHFAGKEYDGQTCYFSLEKPQDAYELSFVAIPAQQNAGTVKSYGEKPCYQADMEAESGEKVISQENLHTREEVSGQNRLTVNRNKTAGPEANRLTINQVEPDALGQLAADIAQLSAKMSEMVAILTKNAEESLEYAPTMAQNAPKSSESTPNDTDITALHQANQASGAAEISPSENLHTRETASSEEENRLTVNQVSAEKPPEETNRLTINQIASDGEDENLHTSDQAESEEPNRLTVNRLDESESDENRLTVNQMQENGASNPPENLANPGEEENLHTRETDEEDSNRLTINRVEEGETDENRLTVNQVSDEQPEDEKRLIINRLDESAEPTPPMEEKPDADRPQNPLPPEEQAETEKAQKLKEAQARLRALQLAISFNHYTK